MAREQYPVILKDSTLIAPSVRHLIFQRPENEAFPYIAGQFINIHFEYEGEIYQRSYSLAAAPEAKNSIEIAIAFVQGGKASDILCQMKAGETLHVSGPFGRLVLKDEDQPQRYVLVATGTGVAPYRAMLTVIAARLAADPTLRVDLLLGARKEEELLYSDDFLAFAQQHERFRFFGCISQGKRSDDAEHLFEGRVTALFDELQLNAAEDIVYLCGNPNMIDEAYELCTEKGFNFKNVKREKYVFSK